MDIMQKRKETTNEILELISKYDRVACNRYTGFGKSYYIIKMLTNTLSGKILILVPNRTLLTQYEELYDKDKVKVSTYQILRNINKETLKREYLQIRYIICDECHHLGKNKWKNELERINKVIKAKIIGFTATPERGDGVNVIETFFNGVQTSSFELLDGISCGFVPNIKYVVAFSNIEDNVNKKLNEVDRYKINQLLNVPEILGKHIDLERLMDNIKILVYVPRVKYIKSAVSSAKQWFSQLYPSKNVNIYSLSSAEHYKENIYQLEQFRNNTNKDDIDILVSVDMVVEGLHLPEISIEIMLRKTKSPVVYFQQLGRVINEKQPIIFDLINNSKHIYQAKKEYEHLNEYQLSKTKQPKMLFSDCIELVDETKEIIDILTKYQPLYNKIPDDIINKVLSEDNLSYGEIANKYNISYASVANIFSKHNKYRLDSVYKRDLYENIYNENKEYIKDNMGKIPRADIAKMLNIPESVLITKLKRDNISYNRMYSSVINNISEEQIELFIKLKQQNKLPKEIKQIMSLDDREYNALMRNPKVKNKVSKNQRLTVKEYEDKKSIIIKHGEGKTVKQLIDLSGLSEATIRKVARENNINIKLIFNNIPPKPEEEHEIIELYKQHKSINKVVKLTGRHKVTIRKILDKYKVR